MNTHGLTIDFGKHRGLLYTRAPVQYLRWMVQCNHSRAEIARAELDRRGTVLPEVDVSGHAIDSASLRLRRRWHETARDDSEGLHAWLCRMCSEALAQSEPDNEGRIFYNGMKLVFEDGEWPVLKTCMLHRKSLKECQPQPTTAQGGH